MSQNAEFIRSDALDGVVHGFFTRRGGVSGGIYASLNVGIGSRDNPDHVMENRKRAEAALGMKPGALSTLYQVHGGNVVTATAPIALDQRSDADGIVTDKPGVLLGILTADCTPVLFADRKKGVIGACHAGWQGAIRGVCGATVAAMEDLGANPGDITAVIGPTILQESYEVGPEYVARFIDDDPANARFFRDGERAGHAYFDLQGYVASRLERLGLGGIQRLAMDTCADEERFFSNRRALLNDEGDYGRQLSAIALAP